MGLDSLCLAAVLRELEGGIVPARVDKIHQPSRDEVMLALRGPAGNVRLLLSAHPGSPRIQLTAVSRENPGTPPMFCMLLRKHLTGGRLLALRQPQGERIAELVFERTDELGDRTEKTLVLEAIGRAANLILVDSEGRIVDCIRRAGGDLSSGKRALLPGLFYVPPEPHAGVPPLLARELAFRGEIDLDAGLARLADEIAAGRAAPTMLVRDGAPVDFSFLPILQYGPGTENRRFESFSALLDDYYAERERRERAGQRGRDLVKAATAARNRTARKLEQQRLERAKAQNREALRQTGDLITSNLHRLERGMARATLENYYDPDGGTAEVALDPLLTPQQNAARYYKDYTKAKTAEAVLAVQIEQGERQLEYLDSVLEGIALSEGDRDLAEIRAELTATGYLRTPKKQAARKEMKGVSAKPMEFFSSGGLRISAGKNNAQNDRLTLKLAGRDDLWLHAQKLHGSHVILWCDGQTPDAQSLTEAAMLAAWFSKGRGGQNVPVDYTHARFVKKPTGALPGKVIYTTYQTAYVTPDEGLVNGLRRTPEQKG